MSFPTPPSTGHAKLSKPIAIPANDSECGSPFLRAYPPELASFGISHDAFLEFLDNLNRVAAPNGPLMTLGYAGGIVSLVPEPAAMIVGDSVSAAAEIATEELSKIRVQLLLRKANPELFAPRGLHAKVVKLENLAEIAGIPILRPLRPSEKWSKRPALDKTEAILPRLENSEEMRSLSPPLRRVKALQPWTAALEVEESQLPPPRAKRGSNSADSGIDAGGRDGGKDGSVSNSPPSYSETPPGNSPPTAPSGGGSSEQKPPSMARKLYTAANKWEQDYNEKQAFKKRVKAEDKYRDKKSQVLRDYERRLQALSEDEARTATKAARNREAIGEEELARLAKKQQRTEDEFRKRLQRVETGYRMKDSEEKEVRRILFLMITNA